MNDELRTACEAELEALMKFDLPSCEEHAKELYDRQLERLVTFAKQQRAEVWEQAAKMCEDERGYYGLQMAGVLREQKAKELET